MQDTQTFVWGTDNTVATLEVRHHKFEMLLNVVTEVAEKVRAKMAELNKGGMYPNEETTSEGGLFAQFIIAGGYNWNSRWRDFKTILNETLDLHGVEKGEATMTDLRVTTMVNTHDAVQALKEGTWDVVVSNSADLDGEPTCHILFLPENEARVTPLLPETKPVPDWDGAKRVIHYGHSAHQVILHIGGYELDLQDKVWDATLEGLGQEALADQLAGSPTDQAFFEQDMELFFDTMAAVRGPGAVVDFIEEGGFVTCPHCLENYWSEDGHPRGTLCPVFGIVAEKSVQEELPGDKGFFTCTTHQTRYWYEDGCPDCWAEVEEQET